MRGADITEQPGRVDQATCAAAESPHSSAAAPFISDEGEGVELMRALLHAKAVFQLRAISTALGLNQLQNIACENPDTLRGTFSVGLVAVPHSNGDT